MEKGRRITASPSRVRSSSSVQTTGPALSGTGFCPVLAGDLPIAGMPVLSSKKLTKKLISAITADAHAATITLCQNRKSISYGSALDAARMMSVSAGIARTASVPTKACRQVLSARRTLSGRFTRVPFFRCTLTRRMRQMRFRKSRSRAE